MGLRAAGLAADFGAPLLLSVVDRVPEATLTQVSSPYGGGPQVDLLLVGSSQVLSAGG